MTKNPFKKDVQISAKTPYFKGQSKVGGSLQNIWKNLEEANGINQKEAYSMMLSSNLRKHTFLV